MTDINYSAILRQLVTDYFDQRIDKVEYFTKRRDILDRIDRDFNGEGETRGWADTDITQPQDITRPSFPKARAGDDFS